MSGTLADAKSELGHVEAQLDAHKRDCLRCQVARRRASRCDERLGIEASARELRAEIKRWFAPAPDHPSLF